MKSDTRQLQDDLIRWMKDHTDNPGNDLTGCSHCEMLDMAQGNLPEKSDAAPFDYWSTIYRRENMPHDKNGVELHLGDVVRVPSDGVSIKHEQIGGILSITKSDKCNLTIQSIGKSYQSESYESLPTIMINTVSACNVEKLA